MASAQEALDDDLIDWIGQQHLFFVATAPSGDDGHVNLSPKGYDTFRILDDHTVAYLDLTGSGVETIAHLRENGRITLMFCAFEGRPNIVRLYGQGDVLLPAGEQGDHGAAAPAEFDELMGLFPSLPGIRSIIRCRIERVSQSCGYSVPHLTYQDERETLVKWSAKNGEEKLRQYRSEKNAQSIDGLEGISAG